MIALLGLQGSSKTTTAAKLACGCGARASSLLVSTDVRRPAAIQQLSVLAVRESLRVYDPAGESDPVARARGAVTEAKNLGCDVVIVDTAGRLHIDDELMDELVAIKTAAQPTDLLYVADAMTGQDAIKSAGEFNRRIGVTGVVLSKIDGDARGGAALSVVAVVGVPIAFVGSGERSENLEVFHPDRIVSRLLGMGDVLSLIERAEQSIDAEEAVRLQERFKGRLHPGGFSAAVAPQADGPLGSDPRHAARDGQSEAVGGQKPDEAQIGRVEAIIGSDDAGGATELPDHQRQPAQANRSGQRDLRREINQLLKQFVQMRKMLKTVSGLAGGSVDRKTRALGLVDVADVIATRPIERCTARRKADGAVGDIGNRTRRVRRGKDKTGPAGARQERTGMVAIR